MLGKWTYLLLFGSGLSALTYQVVWMREFRLVFGVSTASTAAVSALFMAGLGVGGWLLGPRADREPRPLLFYAKLELIISIFAALSPFLLYLTRAIYLYSGGAMVLGGFGATLARLLLAAVVLGLPTVLMGGTLPAAVRAVTSESDGSRRSLGILYGVNTLGALTGVVLTTFYFLEMFGARATLFLAVALNLLVVAAARQIGQRMPALDIPAQTETPETVAPAAAAGTTGLSPQLALATAGGVGFAFFLMELVWYRMLAPVLGGSTYTFGMILAVALAGIGLGGAAYPIIIGERRASAGFLAATCLLEALFMMIPYAIGDWLVALTVQILPLSALGFNSLVGAWLLVAMVVVFPASFISGVQFPLLIALLGRGAKDIGKQTGRAYACNTTGAILGSLAGGFGLLPWLTAPRCWVLVGVLLAVIGICIALSVAFTSSGESKRHRVFTGVGAAVLVVLLFSCFVATGPTAAWRHSPVGAGRTATFNSVEAARAWMGIRRMSLAWEADGVESAVGITHDESYSFLVNGKSDGNVFSDKGTQIMVGMVAAALHPQAKKAMVVGLGTGCTAGWLAAVDGMERVDVVELEPAVLHMAKLCEVANLDVVGKAERGEGVRIIINDAREVLTTIPEKYDVIASEPSNPYRAGIASLFTREFYEQVRNRLTDDGLFVSWCQAYEIDTETVFTILATLKEVFPYVECWSTQSVDLAFIGSMKPINPDPARVAARLSEKTFSDAMRIAWGMEGLEGFASTFIGTNDFIEEVVKTNNRGINTDDLMLVEYDYARTVGRFTKFSILDLENASIKRGTNFPAWLPEDIDKERILLCLTMRPFFEGKISVKSEAFPQSLDQRLTTMELWRQNNLAVVANRQPSQDGSPHRLEQLAVAESYAEFGREETLERIAAFEDWWPACAAFVRARYALAKNDAEAAVSQMETAFGILRKNPWEIKTTASRFDILIREILRREPKYADRLYAALDEPFSVRSMELKRRECLLNVAAFIGVERQAQVIKDWFEPNPPWNKKFLETRVGVYVQTNNPLTEKAVQDLMLFNSGERKTVEELLTGNP